MRMTAWCAPAMLVLIAGCARNYYGSATSWTHQNATRVTAQGIDRVRIESRQGPIRFEADSSNEVTVQLRIGPARGAMGVARDCAVDPTPPVATLRRDDRVLTIGTDRSVPENCVAEWTVTLPRNLAVEAKVVAGDITVEGMSGGVTAEASSAGHIRIRVASGGVDAETGVGSVELDYSGNTHGNLSARTRVGNIALTVNGRKLSHRGAPGSGDELRLDGDATNPIRLAVNVGDIDVRVGVPR
jgi:hypothetical protein